MIGVYCYDMAVAAGITLDQLYAWNPALNGDYSDLWPRVLLLHWSVFLKIYLLGTNHED